MLLKNLFSNLPIELSAININGISFDSRNTKKGDLFVSIKGNKFNGDDFINHALGRGAKVIVHSHMIKKKRKAIYIKVKDSREVLASLTTKYYLNKPRNIVAVTGTNGKTSIADFFHQIFLLQNKKVGFIGTLGFKQNKNLKTRDLTTSNPITLNKDLNKMKKDGVENVILEASSHGLKQKRLDFLKIKAGIFTNLSRDHLDYHKSMKDYLNSKLLLFKKILKRGSFIITDTDIKQYKILKKIQVQRNLKIYTIGSKSNVLKILSHEINKDYQILEVKFKNKIYKLKIKLFGSVQIKNLFMAILAAKICGLNVKSIFKNINKIKSIDGRLELIKTLPNKSKIFLDYAHTPHALETAILSLKEHFQKKITIIFGCGGERDKGKRKLMGNIARKYCNKIYVTDDNPRNENPKRIRRDIMKGLKGSGAKEIQNRNRAIIYALKNSDPNEIILIAGKGHENYQYIGEKKFLLSDKKIVKKFKSPKILLNKKFNELKNNAQIIKKVLKKRINYFFDGVSINSKKINNKNLFIAIKGKKNDGHNFLNEALKNKASYCIISKKKMRKKKFIYVKNTMNFLKELAKKTRESSHSRFIAITGSTGKTTVKTMIGNLLRRYSKTYFSPHSYNNHYGVPLSICNMSLDDDYGVFEIGMNRMKEIHKLSAMVKPHIAVITNISEAHLENFKNINGIAKAKSEIIYNIQKGGTIVLNKDDKFFEYFSKIAKKNGIKIKSFGYSQKSNIKFINIKKRDKFFLCTISIDKKNIQLKINNNNENYIMNIMCCLAIVKELNLNLSKLKNFFQKQAFLKGRGKINKVRKFSKNFFLIDESYNANPLSVKSAIRNFSNIKKGNNKKYFLFGDMLELGKNSQIYHKNISNFINNSDIDKTFVFGDKSVETFKLLKKNKKGAIVKDFQSFDNKISKILKNGDFLMIKGSNATKLHEVSRKFLRGATNAL